MQREDGFVIGTDNVFADLGLDDPDELLLKAKLVQKISHVINENGWTQKQAAAVLGIDQPKVSALVRGKLSGFSVDRLLRFVGALGFDVQLTLTPKTSSRPPVAATTNTEAPLRVERVSRRRRACVRASSRSAPWGESTPVHGKWPAMSQQRPSGKGFRFGRV